MGERISRSIMPYGFALVAVEAALLLKLVADIYVAPTSPFVLFFLPIFASAWYGGLGSGVFATIAAGLTAYYFFLEPPQSFFEKQAAHGWQLAIFVLEGSLLSWIGAMRHRAERSLKLRERRFRALIENSSDAIVLLSPDGTILYRSPSTTHILGYSDEEFLGRSAFTLVHPDDVSYVRSLLIQLLESPDNPQSFQFRYRHRNGGWRWLEGVGTNLIRRPGIWAIVINYRDVTQRREEERRKATQHAVTRVLAESQTLPEAGPRILQAIGECLEWQSGALWTVDRQAEVLRCVDLWHLPSVRKPEFEEVSRQRTFARGIGLPGRIWSSGDPAWIEDITEDTNFPRAAIAAKEGLHSACGFPICVGAEVLGVMEFFSHEIRQPDDDLLRMTSAIGSQIGQFLERKRAEAALAERARLASLRADINATFAASDSLPNLLQQCAELLVKHLEVAFARIWLLNDPPSSPPSQGGDNKFSSPPCEGGDEGGSVLELQASAGEYTHLDGPHSRIEIGQWKIGRIAQTRQPHVTNDVLNDPQISDPDWAKRQGMVAFAGYPLTVEGRVIGVIGMFSRQPFYALITDELPSLAHGMAQCIQRKRADDALQEAHRRKDEFLVMLAHELRNPLAPISNALHLMRLAPQEVALNRARDVIERQVQHMTRIVDDLLDVSRITRGKITLRKEIVNLAEAVADAVEIARPVIEGRQHHFTVSLPSQTVSLKGDPTRLEQILVNLLHNAAKYTDAGGHIWLTAELTSPDAPNETNGEPVREIVIKVCDTGMGIARDMLPRIFDLFTQGDHSLDRAQGGLGIGLTLVRRLVELHGGTIHATSAGPGKGSEFVVRLPILSAGSPEREGVASYGDWQMPHEVSPSRRVLIVDDNRDAADSLAMLLELEGHEVRAVHDGYAALDIAQEFHPNVVLLDIGLPKIDGYEVARRLRGQPEMRQALLIAMTGYGQKEDRRRSEEAGFDQHLVKPVKPDVLRELFAKHGVEDAASHITDLPCHDGHATEHSLSVNG